MNGGTSINVASGVRRSRLSGWYAASKNDRASASEQEKDESAGRSGDGRRRLWAHRCMGMPRAQRIHGRSGRDGQSRQTLRRLLWRSRRQRRLDEMMEELAKTLRSPRIQDPSPCLSVKDARKGQLGPDSPGHRTTRGGAPRRAGDHRQSISLHCHAASLAPAVSPLGSGRTGERNDIRNSKAPAFRERVMQRS